MSAMVSDAILGALGQASAGLESQSIRLRLASENLSNADTPGYRRKLVSFEEAVDGVRAGRISMDQSEGRRLFDPAHPMADAAGTVELSNVNYLIELADAREAGRGYEANLKVFSEAQRLYSNLLGILKR